MIPPELQSILNAMPESQTKTMYMRTLTSDDPLYANGREWLIKYLSGESKPAAPKSSTSENAVLERKNADNGLGTRNSVDITNRRLAQPATTMMARLEPGATEPDEPSYTQTVDKCPMPTAAVLMDRLKHPKPLPDTPVMADAAFFEAENKILTEIERKDI